MNRHVNRTFRVYRETVTLDKNNTVRLVKQDGMPGEVATEMLTALKARLTNRQRKTCQEARSRVFESVFEVTPAEDKLARKMKSAKWNQLLKWNQRAINRRADVQVAYLLALRRREKLQALEVDPKNEQENMSAQTQLAVLNRAIAGLELKAAQLDMFWSAVDDEFTRRKLLHRRPSATLKKMQENEYEKKYG